MAAQITKEEFIYGYFIIISTQFKTVAFFGSHFYCEAYAKRYRQGQAPLRIL